MVGESDAYQLQRDQIGMGAAVGVRPSTSEFTRWLFIRQGVYRLE